MGIARHAAVAECARYVGGMGKSRLATGLAVQMLKCDWTLFSPSTIQNLDKFHQNIAFYLHPTPRYVHTAPV
jgi:hypothetical protein